MSFNPNHIISLDNYQEWFLLFVDDELDSVQKEAVSSFLLLHPHLQEELDLLLSTKLPSDDVMFWDKASLKADAMKLGTIDESLLLYIDNELSAPEKEQVEEKIKTDNDFRLQHQLLQKTKLDATEVITYPDKTSLYRHTEKVVTLFPVWMRIAVAVVLLLFAALFFLNNGSDKPASPNAGYARKEAPEKSTPQKLPLPANSIREAVQPAQPDAIARNGNSRPPAKKREPVSQPVAPHKSAMPQQLPVIDEEVIETVALATVEPVKPNMSVLTKEQAVALNKIVANPTVTSVNATTYNNKETPEEPAVTDGDFKPKRSSAKGLLRKVSRFLERRTGIGTANADDEILVGALSLKLN